MGLQANTGLQPEQGAKAACCHTTAVAPGVMRWPRAPHCGATSHHQPRASHRSAAPPGAGWCPDPLRAPPARADHAVPPGAAARRDLLRRRRPPQVRACRPSSKTSSMHFSSAASWRTVSFGCAAATAATTSWWHSAASAGGFAPRAARGAWRRLRRAGSSTPACAGAPVGAVTADPAFARHSQSTGLTVSGLSYCWPRSPSG